MAHSTAAETLDKITVITIATTIVIIVVPGARIADLCISVLAPRGSSSRTKQKTNSPSEKMAYVESSFLSRHLASVGCLEWTDNTLHSVSGQTEAGGSQSFISSNGRMTGLRKQS